MKTIGVDLGGKSIKCGIVDDGKILTKKSIGTDVEGGYTAILKDIINLCKELLKEAPDAGFVGVGSPGIIVNGKVDCSYNVSWSDAPLKEDLKRALKKETDIANDAVCAAIAEYHYGAGKNFRSMAMITLGTGVGGTFIDNNEIKKGMVRNLSYLFGHITVVSDGLPCTCGRKGCLEAYASASAIEKRAQSEYGKNLSAREVFELARQKDERAVKIIKDFNMYLGDGIVSICNMIRPEVIVIGGGLSGSADLILPEINDKLSGEVYGFHLMPVKASAAQLGNDAGIIGAANLNKQTGADYGLR
jgi:glucokinase